MNRLCTNHDRCGGFCWTTLGTTNRNRPRAQNDSVFDAIVVGGGPGGSSAAGYLAMAGKKVLLIEKGVWPRDKVCGDAVGGKSLGHVAALGVKTDLEATPHFRVTGLSLIHI